MSWVKCKKCDNCGYRNKEIDEIYQIMQSTLTNLGLWEVFNPCTRYEFIMSGIRCLSRYISRKLFSDIKEKDKEIERLNNELQIYKNDMETHPRWCGFKSPGVESTYKFYQDRIAELEKQLAETKADYCKDSYNYGLIVGELKKKLDEATCNWKPEYDYSVQERIRLEKENAGLKTQAENWKLGAKAALNDFDVIAKECDELKAETERLKDAKNTSR